MKSVTAVTLLAVALEQRGHNAVTPTSDEPEGAWFSVKGRLNPVARGALAGRGGSLPETRANEKAPHRGAFSFSGRRRHPLVTPRRDNLPWP